MNAMILIIEDEDKISRLLQLELTHEGYTVEIAVTGREGLLKASENAWDVILLDIMLPELSGIEVLRKFRKRDKSTPIILLTARDTTQEVVDGLDQGANDYITKPFKIEELLARIRTCMRNKSLYQNNGNKQIKREANEIRVNCLVVNTRTRQVLRDGRKIDLTPKEFNLLTYLIENKNRVVNRAQIIQKVWGYDFIGNTNVVDVYIRYIRKKIDDDFDPPLIQTVRGIGYCIKESDNEDTT